MSNPIIERIQREAGVPELIDVLAERLNPTDLQSLLLEVALQYSSATRVRIEPRQLFLAPVWHTPSDNENPLSLLGD